MFRNPFSSIVPLTQLFSEHPEIYKCFKINGHNGIDFGVPVGTEIFSVCDGVCSIGYDATGYGNYVRLLSSQGEEILFAHLSSVLVQDGEKVLSGKKIALSGNTGFSISPHLHLGLRIIKNGVIQNYQNGYLGYIDPLPYFSDYKKQEKSSIIQSIPEEKPVMPQKKIIQERPSSWAQDAYNFVREEQISNGERPQDLLSREEFWLMLYRFTEALEMDMDLDEHFEEIDFRKLAQDQRPSEWAEFAYLWAKNMEISHGERPKEYITREEVWLMLYRLFEQEMDFVKRNMEPQEKSSAWARLAQNWVIANGISNGKSPFEYIQREEVWLIFLHLAEKISNP